MDPALVFILAMSVSLISFNLNGCADKSKQNEIAQHLLQTNSDIILLQETHFTAGDENRWNLLWGNHIFFCHGTSASGGMAILLSPKIKNASFIKERTLLPGRCQYVNITINNQNLHIINIHAPNSGEDRIKFLKSLDTFLTSLDANDIVILGGDYNSTTNPEIDRRSKRETHKPSSNALMSLVQKHNLSDVWRDHHPNSIQFTWFKNEGLHTSSAARLDRFYISKHSLNLTRCASIQPRFRSDHRPLRFYMQLAPPSSQNGHWCLNQSILKEQNYTDIINHFWAHWKTTAHSFSSPALWWDVGKNHIKSITREYCSSRSRSLRENENRLKTEIAFLEAQNTLSEEALNDLDVKKKELDDLTLNNVRGACIRTKFHHLRRLNAPTRFFFDLERREGCQRHISHLQNEKGEVITDSEKIEQIAKSFYEDLYTKSATDSAAQDELLRDLPQLSDLSKDLLEDDLSLDEFTAAIKESPCNKTPGIDGIPFEFYRHFWNTIGEDLYNVFMFSLHNNDLPKSLL